MSDDERLALEHKHRIAFMKDGKEVCHFCSDLDFVGRITPFPCDVITVLDYLDVVKPIPLELKWDSK